MQSGSVIADIERLNWSLAAISDVTRVLVRAKTEHEVFLAACEAATRNDFFDLAWVGLPRQDAKRTVVIGACAGRARDFAKDVEILWADVPLGRGPTGTAIRTGKLQICNAADQDDSFKPWIVRMKRFGLRSSLALPIRLPNGSVIASMTVYSRHPEAFGDHEAKLFAQLGQDIGFGIDMLRTRAAYRDALAYSEQQDRRIQMLGAALESSSDGVMITDKGGRIFSINSAFARITGYSADEVTGRSPAMLAAAQGDVKHAFAGLEAGAALPAAWRGEVLCRRKSGAPFPALISLNAVRDEQGSSTHTIATLTDITEQKKAEEAVRAEKLFSDAMMESMPGIIYFYDRDGRFQRWNRNFALVSGYTDAEITEMHPLDFFHAEDKELLRQRIDEVFEHGQSWVEAPFLTKSGKTIPYFFTGRRVEIGGREFLIGVGIDMSVGNCVTGVPPRPVKDE